MQQGIGFKSRFRHYVNLAHEPRIRQLLRDFPGDRMDWIFLAGALRGTVSDLPMNATAELTCASCRRRFSCWDDFIPACFQATFFHRAGWKNRDRKGILGTAARSSTPAGGWIEGNLAAGRSQKPVVRPFAGQPVVLRLCRHRGRVGAAHAALDQAAQALAAKLKVEHPEYCALEAWPSDWATRMYVTFRKGNPVTSKPICWRFRCKQRRWCKATFRSKAIWTMASESVSSPAYSAQRDLKSGVPWYGAKKYFRVSRAEVFGKGLRCCPLHVAIDPVASVPSFYFPR